MFDVSRIQQFNEAEHFPMRGNNCYTFFRECEYYGACNMSPQFLFGGRSIEEIPLLKELTEETHYDFKFTIEELIEAQRSKLGFVA